jgi:hypothetical protein
MIDDWWEEIDRCELQALCMSEFASREAERRKIPARINEEHEAAVVVVVVVVATATRNSTVRLNLNSKHLHISAAVVTSCF